MFQDPCLCALPFLVKSLTDCGPGMRLAWLRSDDQSQGLRCDVCLHTGRTLEAEMAQLGPWRGAGCRFPSRSDRLFSPRITTLGFRMLLREDGRGGRGMR